LGFFGACQAVRAGAGFCGVPRSGLEGEPGDDWMEKIAPSGWLRMAELPIRRTLADDLRKKGVLLSVLVGRPGSKRGVRLVSLESLNAYLMGLANEQRPKNSASSQAVENQS